MDMGRDHLVSSETPRSVDVALKTIIAALRGRPLSACSPDWIRVVDLAAAHGVLQLLHQAVRNEQDAVPAATMDRLKRARHVAAISGAVAARQRAYVQEALGAEGIPYLVMKGGALATRWYGDASLRPFVDIDLLVRQEDLGRARQVLIQEGYTDGPVHPTPHHAPPLYRQDWPAAIELHHTLTRLAHPEPLDFDRLYPRSIVVEDGRYRIPTLSPEDTLLHLCLHLLAHVEHDHGWQLRSIWDIAAHVRAFPIRWDMYSRQADTIGATRSCSAVLGLATVLTGVEIPDDQVDLERGAALVAYPIPGTIDHRLLAALLVALVDRDLRRATSMVWGQTAGHVSECVERKAVPFLREIGGFVGEIIRKPRYVVRQVRLWLPQARTWRARNRLLEDLGVRAAHVRPRDVIGAGPRPPRAPLRG